jgi:hypothetical protein
LVEAAGPVGPSLTTVRVAASVGEISLANSGTGVSGVAATGGFEETVDPVGVATAESMFSASSASLTRRSIRPNLTRKAVYRPARIPSKAPKTKPSSPSAAPPIIPKRTPNTKINTSVIALTSDCRLLLG